MVKVIGMGMGMVNIIFTITVRGMGRVTDKIGVKVWKLG